ncbi:MAG: hypothetical protein ACI8W8_004773 [Rhodothermales bacterium]|jgi:hypothetical protein
MWLDESHWALLSSAPTIRLATPGTASWSGCAECCDVLENASYSAIKAKRLCRVPCNLTCRRISSLLLSLLVK